MEPTKIDFNGGTFVSSKNGFGYQEILDDFSNSKQVKILTYNISKKSDDLFDTLKSLNEDVSIEIITNIPSRFNYYTSSPAGEYMRDTASKNIKAYLTKLDPKKIEANLVPFFNFNNHCKIIGTENIIYIGSENFSDESALNYEAGVIIKDKEFIKKLYNTFFEKLKSNSTPYFDEDYHELRLYCISILTRLTNHLNKIEETIFFQTEDGRWIFTGEDTSFSEDDYSLLTKNLEEVESIKSIIEDLENEERQEIIKSILNTFENIEVDKTLKELFNDDAFYNYVCFDFDNAFWNCFEEYANFAVDEHLDEYLDKATEDARDILRDLSYEAENVAFLVLDSLHSIIPQLAEIIDILNDTSEFINKSIDNT